jgi:predicted phage terminase large subunit-like protein
MLKGRVWRPGIPLAELYSDNLMIVHLNLPMEFEPGRACETPIWRDPRLVPGEILQPAMFTPAFVEGKRGDTELGPLGYSGQYQQNPIIDGGGIFPFGAWRYWQEEGPTRAPVRWLRGDGEYDEVSAEPIPVHFDAILQSWDCAFVKSKSSDLVAGLTVGVLGARLYLLEIVNRRMGFGETCDAILGMASRWPDVTAILVEGKANGPAVMDQLSDRVPNLVQVPNDIVQSGKEGRAHSCEGFVKANSIYLPHPDLSSQTLAFVAQAGHFPNDAHDDMVDAFTQVAIYVFRVLRLHERAAKPVETHGVASWVRDALA